MKHAFRIVPVALGLSLASCAAPEPIERLVAVFHCPGLGHVVVRHGPDDAIITMDRRDFVLPRDMAASGVRYRKGATQFWEHHGDAVVDLDGRHFEGCTFNPRQSPPA